MGPRCAPVSWPEKLVLAWDESVGGREFRLCSAGLTRSPSSRCRAIRHPLWTENYCFVAYDRPARSGCGPSWRAPFDPTLCVIVDRLPASGERLVNKGYGRNETPRGPAVPPWHSSV